MTKTFIQFITHLLDLRQGAEHKRTIIENVEDDANISSARFWTLVFAIGVASVGLNINSIPVVIGAMLISPLMGPLVSMGLALAIYDWGLMRRSFRNMLVLAGISIFISALYFAISPITNAQSELLARTQPTIFDVLIAIFGGMAGFIGVSRARHNNVIPGVAIATALMPPLCTVGYGIGTWQPQFIYGAFYLFLINSIFICLSALVVASYMKLPKHEYPDEAKKKRVKRILTTITVVIIIPAVYLAYTFVAQNNFNQNVEDYIQHVFKDDGYVLIYENVTYTRTSQSIELAFHTQQFTEAQITNFTDRLADYDLEGTVLNIRQNGFSLTKEEWDTVINQVQNDDEKVRTLEARLESERLSFKNPQRLLEEAVTINKKITNIAIGSLVYGATPNETNALEKEVIFIDTAADQPLKDEEAYAITQWLKARLENENISTHFSPEPVAENTTPRGL